MLPQIVFAVTRCSRMKERMRLITIIAIFTLILGHASCGKDSDPVTPVPSQEPVVLDFLEPVLYPVEEWTMDIVASDLDTDGDYDLIVEKDDLIGILLNNGNGTFQPAVYRSILIRCRYLGSADLDGDGDNDIVLTEGYKSTVFVLLNNGDATFQTPVPVTEESLGNVRRIEAVDLDQDGDEDLLVATVDPDRIVTLLNNGDATFGAPIQGLEGYVSRLTISDLDHDGDADLVGQAGRSFFTSMGNGDGTFQDAVYHGFLLWDFLPEYFQFCVPLDIDSDGDFDIAAGSSSRGTYILLNAGDFTFDMAGCYGEPKGVNSGVAVDMDSDGDNDIVASLADIDSVTVFQNSGDSTFQSILSYYAGIVVRKFVLADLDGDGDVDIAGLDFGSVSIMLSTLNDQGQ